MVATDDDLGTEYKISIYIHRRKTTNTGASKVNTHTHTHLATHTHSLQIYSKCWVIKLFFNWLIQTNHYRHTVPSPWISGTKDPGLSRYLDPTGGQIFVQTSIERAIMVCWLVGRVSLGSIWWRWSQTVTSNLELSWRHNIVLNQRKRFQNWTPLIVCVCGNMSRRWTKRKTVSLIRKNGTQTQILN